MTRPRIALIAAALGVALVTASPAKAEDMAPAVPPSLPDVGGYVVSDVRKVVTGSFFVPALDCGQGDVGMLPLLLAQGTREPLGGAGVEMSCIDGQRTMRPVFISMEGAVDPVDELDVRSGDLVSITVSIRRQDFVVEIVNETRGGAVGSGQSDTRGRLGSVAVGDVGLPGEAGLLDVPSFGAHEFTRLSVDGSGLGPHQAKRSQLLDGEGDVVVRVSRLRDHRSAFTARSTG